MSEPTKKRKPKVKKKDDFWKNAKTATMHIAFEGRRKHHACIRFKCQKCHHPFIGLICDRDRVPPLCSVCDPPKAQEWSWSNVALAS